MIVPIDVDNEVIQPNNCMKKEPETIDEDYCCPICESLGIKIEDDGTITDVKKRR